MNIRQAAEAIAAVPGWALKGVECYDTDDKGDVWSVRAEYDPFYGTPWSHGSLADQPLPADMDGPQRVEGPETTIHLDGSPFESVVNRIVAHAKALTE